MNHPDKLAEVIASNMELNLMLGSPEPLPQDLDDALANSPSRYAWYITRLSWRGITLRVSE
jgi:hypothetical protein